MTTLLRSTLEAADGVEHITIHWREAGELVIGVFLLASSLDRAEAAAERACRSALDRLPRMGRWHPVSVTAPMVPAYYEQLMRDPPV
ncbi:hypothetical protein [Streptomyces sp. NPDC000877]|uniref:hypothetical protein n=1 Tax=unclassified Streptomyces TaxID=2593676 RepID=UPI00331A520C